MSLSLEGQQAFGELTRGQRRWGHAISGLIALRVGCAGLFLYAFLSGLDALAVVAFLLGSFTDALDGCLVRAFHVCPSLGPYSDAVADFALVAAAFGAFVSRGLYPTWVLVLIGGMFVQFALTSGQEKPLYDPLGKYYGVFLLAAIGVTLALPNGSVRTGVLVGIVGFTIASLASRLRFLLGRRQRARPTPWQS